MADTLPRCDEINGVIYQLEQSGQPDSLVVMLALIDRAQVCKGNATTTRQAWLSVKKVWGLDKLGRYSEAEAETERFFRDETANVPTHFLTSMHLHRFRLRWLRGNLLGAVDAYFEGHPDFETLPPSARASSALDLVKVYIDVGAIPEAQARLNALSLETGTVGAARALALRGMIALADSSFAEALPLFTRVAATFDSLGTQGRQAGALIGVGRALHGLGNNKEAFLVLTKAIELATEAHAYHFAIYGLYRRGALYISQGRTTVGLRDLNRAAELMDSTGLYEHEAEVAAATGDALALQNNVLAALGKYEKAMSAAEHRQNVDAIRAAWRAEMAAGKLALEKPASPLWPWLAALTVLLLVVGLKARQRNRQRRAIDGLLMPRRRRNWTPHTDARRIV